MAKKFIGRSKELKQLEDLQNLDRPCLVVIKGRRRIGKSRLAAEFANNKRFLSFSGLAPIDDVTAQDQRNTFAGQFAQNMGLPPLTFLDWSDAFSHLSRKLSSEPTVILFDEISWMGSKDPTFIPKLKNWWDLELQRFPKLTLILCGSVSTWIQENIINSTAFFGRVTLQIDLEELSLFESKEFLNSVGFKGSTYDIFKILAVTGGVPWYLEQILPNETADANLKRLSFEKNGLFTNEFDHIFHDLFNGKGSTYKKIVRFLAEGMKDLTEIRQAIELPPSGFLSTQMDALIASGFVQKHDSWSFRTGEIRKSRLHRLTDNYLRFFIKYIEPSLAKIQKKTYQDISLSQLPGWDTMMGFQIENLLLKNRKELLKALGLHPADVLMDNPYVQKPTGKQRGCQIDYLVQTHTKGLYLCEFKFNRRELGSEIVDAMKEKEKRFLVPRGFAKIPVLFHLGDVAETVHDSRYFYRIIDIADFL